MQKEYKVSDLFFDRYSDLSVRKLGELAPLRHVWLELSRTMETPQEQTRWGLLSIAILRILRKKPLLVDQITPAQAVDCINDLTFLKEPWFNFPPIHKYFTTPDEYMHNRTFDHFIYADHEFSKITLMADPDTQSMARLAACLYDLPKQAHFDEDVISERAWLFDRECSNHQLAAVLYTYANVRAWVVDRCKNLFPTASGTSDKSASEPTGGMWKDLKQRTAELRLTWKDPSSQETNYVGHGRYLEVLDHLESISKRKNTA